MSENTSTNPEKYKTITIMSESTPTDPEKYTKNYHVGSVFWHYGDFCGYFSVSMDVFSDIMVIFWYFSGSMDVFSDIMVIFQGPWKCFLTLL
jgi:hypothetical protein